jgi:hypothetical protein
MKIAGRFLPEATKQQAPMLSHMLEDEINFKFVAELHYAISPNGHLTQRPCRLSSRRPPPLHATIPWGLWLDAGRRTDLGKLVAPTTVINRVELHQIRQTASKLIIESKILYGKSLDSIKKAITQLCRGKGKSLRC